MILSLVTAPSTVIVCLVPASSKNSTFTLRAGTISPTKLSPLFHVHRLIHFLVNLVLNQFTERVHLGRPLGTKSSASPWRDQYLCGSPKVNAIRLRRCVWRGPGPSPLKRSQWLTASFPVDPSPLVSIGTQYANAGAEQGRTSREVPQVQSSIPKPFKKRVALNRLGSRSASLTTTLPSGSAASSGSEGVAAHTVLS